jgi:hypothetical protein
LTNSNTNFAKQAHLNAIATQSLTPFGARGSIFGMNILGEAIDCDNKYVKKSVIVEITEDVLALSVTWHRLRTLINQGISTIDRPTKLIDDILFKEMIQEDREKANIIRDYYSKKLMMSNLRGQRISNYRKDLSIFIHGDSKVVKEEFMPLIYRLPEFHEHDIGTDEMFRNLNTRFEGPEQLYTKVLNLTPIKKFAYKRKSGKFVEYWLKDSDNIPYKIEVSAINELIHLWDYIFDKDQSIRLNGLIKFMERDGVHFNKLFTWTLA